MMQQVSTPAVTRLHIVCNVISIKPQTIQEIVPMAVISTKIDIFYMLARLVQLLPVTAVLRHFLPTLRYATSIQRPTKSPLALTDAL